MDMNVVSTSQDSQLASAKMNIFVLLNQALRQRRMYPKSFSPWRGFLFFMLRALEQLPTFQGVVFRGGNRGIDQVTVKKEYKKGRPIQWGGFSSTTLDRDAAVPFVHKATGVLFKISVVSGRDIGAFSFFPREREILLSPRCHFTVASDMYFDDEGYACLDLVEIAGNVWSS